MRVPQNPGSLGRIAPWITCPVQPVREAPRLEPEALLLQVPAWPVPQPPEAALMD